MEDAYYLEVYVPMSNKWTIAYIKKAGITEDNRHAEISTTYPHQAATPKHQMLKWRHCLTKWSTRSNADDCLHQRRDKTLQLTESLMAVWSNASQYHEIFCHGPEVMDSNPSLVELGVCSPSVYVRLKSNINCIWSECIIVLELWLKPPKFDFPFRRWRYYASGYAVSLQS